MLRLKYTQNHSIPLQRISLYLYVCLLLLYPSLFDRFPDLCIGVNKQAFLALQPHNQESIIDTSIYLSIYLSSQLYIYLSIYKFTIIYVSIYLLTFQVKEVFLFYLYIYLTKYLYQSSIYMYIYIISIYLSIYLRRRAQRRGRGNKYSSCLDLTF